MLVTKNAKKKRVPGTTNPPASIPNTPKASEKPLKKTATTATVATKKAPARPAPPAKLPKTSEGEKPNGKKKEEPKIQPKESQPGTSAKASEPVITSERQSPPAEPRPAYPGEVFYKNEAQLSLYEMREMSYKDRLTLFKKLNDHASEGKFVTLLKPSVLPKKMQMRLDEAKLRELAEAKPHKEALWCPYCVTWQPFHNHAWTGYRKCCGCSMSTKDFYIAVDNGIFGKE